MNLSLISAFAIVVSWMLRMDNSQLALLALPPEHGVVKQKSAICCERDGCLIRVITTPVLSDNIPSKEIASATRFLPARWHVGHNAFWIAGSRNMADFYSESFEGVLRYDLASLIAGKLVPKRLGGFDGSDIDIDPDFEGNGSYPGGPYMQCETLRDLHFLFGTFDPKFHFDYLPNGSDRVKLLLLTNLRGSLEPFVDKSTGLLLGGGLINQSEEEYTNPKWSLVVYDHQGYWDLKKKCWVDGPWKRGEEIAVGFEEGFHALEKDGTYYFITDSGRIFAAPRGEKGKPRPMRTVWNDKARRIKLFLTDADSERTWLFTCPGKKGEPAVYFELGQKAEPTPYDPLKLPKATGDDPLRTVLRHARFLVAEKKIKVGEAKP